MKLLRTIKKRFSGQPTNGRRSSRGRAQLSLEALECRVTPTVKLTNGHLLVTGAPNDQITVGLNNITGGVLVIVDNSSFSFVPGKVLSIEVDTASTGASSVFVTATLASVPLTINSFGTGSPREDQVTLGADANGNDGSVDSILGPVSVNGNGLTSASFDESVDPISDSVTITSTSVNRAAFGGLTYTGLASLEFDESLTNSITFNVNSTMINTAYYWERLPGQGLETEDTFNLGTGSLLALQGRIYISGTDVTMVLDDHTSVGAHGYTIDRTRFGNSVSGEGWYAEFDSAFRSDITIDGGIGNDAFNLMPVAQNLNLLNAFLIINGGSGSNTLTLNDQNNPFADTYSAFFVNTAGLDCSTGPVIHYSGIQSATVNGANAGSTFDVASSHNGTSLICNAGQGVNNVVVGNSSHGVSDIQGALDVSGGAGGTTVTLDDHASTIGRQFSVTNQLVRFGTGQVSYSGITNLQLDGGAGGNNFAVLSTAFGVTTTINAGPNGDAIGAGQGRFSTVDNCLGPLVINGQRGTTVTVADQGARDRETYTLSAASSGETLSRSNGLVVTCNVIRSLTVNGGLGGDDFVDQAIPTSLVTTFNGGSGLNSLGATEGFGHVTGWHITGPGSGRVGTRLLFTGINDLVGTGAFNDFEFFAGGGIAGTIAGGGGPGNTLGYGNESGPVTVNVQTGAAPQINGGAAGGFSGITNFQGSTAPANTLIGPDADTTWTISKANSGAWITGGRNFEFGRFSNLVGGAGLDVFAFTAGGSLSGKLDGGTAPLHEGNWLNYAALITPVTVNLQTGKATGVAGGVANIQNVHGGNGGNTLTGDAQGNILIGGAGNDIIIGGTGASILIGDAGAGTITGGSGGDILIGGSTVYDPMNAANEAALMRILAEWQSSDSYATRFTDINTGTGGGLNGTARLNGTTVLKNNKVDVLTGASLPGLDWFFQGPGDILHSVEPGEHVTNI
jgi:hypothetical protein